MRGAREEDSSEEDSRVDGQEQWCWCAGLQLQEAREISETDRAHLRRSARGYWWWHLISWLTMPAVFMLLMSTATIIEDTGHPGIPSGIQGAAVLVRLIAIIGLSAQISVAKEWLKRARACAADAHQGAVWRFTGKLPNPQQPPTTRSLSPTQKRLLPYLIGEPRWRSLPAVQRAAWQFEPDAVYSIEVLSGSRRVLRVNDVDIGQRWIRAAVEKTVAPPQISRIAAQWLQSAGVTATGQQVRTGRRELSAAECAELERIVADLRWRHARRLPVLLAIAVLLDSFALGSPADVDLAIALFGGIFSLLALTSIVTVVRCWRLAARMHVDVAARRVIIVEVTAAQTPSMTEKDAAAEATSAAAASGSVLEALPVSRVVWLQDGEPSRWRKAGRLPDIVLSPGRGANRRARGR